MSPAREATVAPERAAQDDDDKENASSNEYNVRRSLPHAPRVPKRLFQTPRTEPSKARPPATPATPLARPGSVARYFPGIRTPHTPASVRRRPPVADLSSTPGVKQNYVSIDPYQWRKRQASDLAAWLNSELVDGSSNPAHMPLENIANSAIYCKQFLAMDALYKSSEVKAVLDKVDTQIFKRRFNVGKRFFLSNNVAARKDLTSLLLNNYNPLWLLFALSVVLGIDFAPILEKEFADNTGPDGKTRVRRVLQDVLKDALWERLLASKLPESETVRVGTPLNADRVSVRSWKRDSYNDIVLSRILHVIYLLDQAKNSHHRIVATDPPLFQYGSKLSSSIEVVRHLERKYLQKHGDVVRYLRVRGYVVSYETPLFERTESLHVTDLFEDLVDGKRLCKLASIMLQDREMLSLLRAESQDVSKQVVVRYHRENVALSLQRMFSYARSQMDSTFSWKGTHIDIVQKHMDRTLAIMWQVVALWLEIVVLDPHALEDELKTVQQEFRRFGTALRSTGDLGASEVSPQKISPTRLSLYENCKTVCSTHLLQWCATVAGMHGIRVRDYTESFRDGSVLCILLHHYCPDLVSFEEITRVRPSDRRPVDDALSELDVAKRNFELFTSRCRILGGVPDISISADAALAPSFSSDEKDGSFGRLVELLVAYLFARVILERHGALNHKRFQCALELQQSALDQIESDFASQAEEELEDESPPEFQADLATEVPGTDDNDIGHDDREDEDLVDKQPSPKMPPSGSSTPTKESFSGNTAEIEAARTILRHYRAFRSRSTHQQRRDAAMCIQRGVRGYLGSLVMAQLADERAQITPDASLGADQQPTQLEASKKLDEDKQPMCTVDEAKSKLTEIARLTPQVLEGVATLMPIFSRHSRSSLDFVDRMVALERSRAAVTIQCAYRCHAARALIRGQQRTRAEVERNRAAFSNVLNGIPGTAKLFAHRIASAAQERMKAHNRLISKALESAAQAYESHMSRTNAESEALEVRRRGIEERMYQDRQMQSEEASALAVQERSLEESISDLAKKVDNMQSQLEDTSAQLPTPNSSPSIPRAPEREATPIRELSIETERIGQLGRMLEETRAREAALSRDIEQNHREWQSELQRRDEELQSWKEYIVQVGLNAAEKAFELEMLQRYEANTALQRAKEACTGKLADLSDEQNESDSAHKASQVEDEVGLQSSHSVKVALEEDSTAQLEKVEAVIHSLEMSLEEFNAMEQSYAQTELNKRRSFEALERDLTSAVALCEEHESWSRTVDDEIQALYSTSPIARSNVGHHTVSKESGPPVTDQNEGATVRKVEETSLVCKTSPLGDFRDSISSMETTPSQPLSLEGRQRIHITSEEVSSPDSAPISTTVNIDTGYERAPLLVTSVSHAASQRSHPSISDQSREESLPNIEERSLASQASPLPATRKNSYSSVGTAPLQPCSEEKRDLAPIPGEQISSPESGERAMRLDDSGGQASMPLSSVDQAALERSRLAMVTQNIPGSVLLEKSPVRTPPLVDSIPENSSASLETTPPKLQSAERGDHIRTPREEISSSNSSPSEVESRTLRRQSPMLLSGVAETAAAESNRSENEKEVADALVRLSEVAQKTPAKNTLQEKEDHSEVKLVPADPITADILKSPAEHSAMQSCAMRVHGPVELPQSSASRASNKAFGGIRRSPVQDGVVANAISDTDDSEDFSTSHAFFRNVYSSLERTARNGPRSQPVSPLPTPADLATSSSSSPAPNFLEAASVLKGPSVEGHGEASDSSELDEEQETSSSHSGKGFSHNADFGQAGIPNRIDGQQMDNRVDRVDLASLLEQHPSANALSMPMPVTDSSEVREVPTSSSARQSPKRSEATSSSHGSIADPEQLHSGTRHFESHLGPYFPGTPNRGNASRRSLQEETPQSSPAFFRNVFSSLERPNAPGFRISSPLAFLPDSDVPTAENIDELLDHKESMEQMQSVLHRLSVSTAEPAPVNEEELSLSGDGEGNVTPSVVKAIFVIVRQCTKRKKQVSLVELGLSVIRNMSRTDAGLMEIFVAEDCIDVLVSCVQVYRDNEIIGCCALESLLNVSSHGVGKGLILDEENALQRLEAVRAMVLLELERKKKRDSGLRDVGIVLEAVRRRRERGSRHFSLSREIQLLRQTAVERDSSASPFIGLLEQLLCRFVATS